MLLLIFLEWGLGRHATMCYFVNWGQIGCGLRMWAGISQEIEHRGMQRLDICPCSIRHRSISCPRNRVKSSQVSLRPGVGVGGHMMWASQSASSILPGHNDWLTQCMWPVRSMSQLLLLESWGREVLFLLEWYNLWLLVVSWLSAEGIYHPVAVGG